MISEPINLLLVAPDKNGPIPHRPIDAVHFRILFDNAPDAILVLGLEGRILDANPAACARLKTERQRLIGAEFAEWVPQDSQAEVKHIYTATAHGTIKPVKITSLDENRRAIPTEIRHSPLNFDGQPAHLLYIRDISEYESNERALQRRNRYLTLLNQAGQAFISSLDLDVVLSTVLNQLRYIMGATAASIWLVDEKGDELVCTHSTEPWFLRGWRLPLGQGIIGWTALKGESMLVSDTRLDERHYKGVDQESGTEIRCILSVPLKAKQRTIGALQVVDSEANCFYDEDIAIMESLATTAAIAIENARLFERVSQDAENRAALVQEVNHRVKNNFSSIIGLLYSELRYTRKPHDPAYTDLIQDLIGRVQSMAQVHTLLSNTEWMPLPLDELTRHMIRTALHVLPNSTSVDFEVTPSELSVSSSQATNLALIINELTTNTVKHALPGRTSAKINVSIALEDNDTVCFEFRNDGEDYPEEVVTHQYYNLGLYLIDTLAKRGLLGALTLHNDHGPVATIRFKRE